jgi:hypothetical protein
MQKIVGVCECVCVRVCASVFVVYAKQVSVYT